jgi:hypothetical protein
MELATATVAILSLYLAEVGKGAAKRIGEATVDKTDAVYNFIRQKLVSDKDEYAEKTLQRLEEQPSNRERQSALASILAEKTQEDIEFARGLSELVKESSQVVGNSIILQKAGENSIQISQARDINIQR